ncbi:hypothetical protein [Paenibacillus odorifer]|uniref:hypothetical protein n=1 Tax=Paenibacillus odorifer TaxID=189426 RepID=UPI00096DC407|nr:hypothetical protein [Paenibacillus odorifer]OMD66888.1 hypothetical protein BSK50_30390 [Paenibacillus odorifer]
MSEVDADLYDFLKGNETGLYRKKDEVLSYVLVDFDRLSKFVEVVGEGCFDESGVDVVMKNNYVAIELNSFIEGFGHYLSSYKNCFDEWDEYKSEILEMEKQYQ